MSIPGSVPLTPTAVAITGGAGGIGRAIARRVIADGERAVLLDLRGADIDDALLELGDNSHGVVCDVTDPHAVAEAAVHVNTELGPVRAVVAAAGWAQRGAFLGSPSSLWQRILDVNLLGVMNVTEAFAASLLEYGENARLVFVSSDAARIGVRDLAVYAAAKAGVNGFARSFALETARAGLTVNVVSAGSTDAPMLTEAYTPEEIEKRQRANPVGRLASPDDIASAVAHFLRSDASYLTGQILSVNGGTFRPC
ncbi:glucose 1-dehydrogenase [Nocardioides humi]|uniref:Glucose 1-dehydrogenase n=1 Tax=Nocardioides humi TaxID=449461 RepID=A0ABN2AFR0_9ACTN